MSTEFDAIIALSRIATKRQAASGELTLEVTSDARVDSLISLAHSWIAASKYYGDREYFEKVADLPPGSFVRLVFRPVVSDRRAIFRNLSELLNYQSGRFLAKAPNEYYLLEEDYSSNEVHSEQSVASKLEVVPTLKKLLDQISDFDAGLAVPVYVILAEGRLDIPLALSSGDLQHLPEASWIAEFINEITAAPLVDAKKRILRRVVRRFLSAWPANQRCGQFVRALGLIKENYEADYSLFESDFNFDKLKEDFQKKQSDYMAKLSGATTDAMSKLLAIPVAQGLLASQMKAGQWLLNSALLAGSIVFSVIAGLVLANQRGSSEQISSEVKKEIEDLKQRYPEQYARLNGAYRVLDRRSNTAVWMPVVLGCLLLVLTLFTIGCYFAVSSQVASGD